MEPNQALFSLKISWHRGQAEHPQPLQPWLCSPILNSQQTPLSGKKNKWKPEGWTGAARGSGSQWSAQWATTQWKGQRALYWSPARIKCTCTCSVLLVWSPASEWHTGLLLLIFKSIPHSFPFREWGRSEQLLSEQLMGVRGTETSQWQQQWSFAARAIPQCDMASWAALAARTCLPSCPTLVCPLTTVRMLSSNLLQEKPQRVKPSFCEPDPNNWGNPDSFRTNLNFFKLWCYQS